MGFTVQLPLISMGVEHFGFQRLDVTDRDFLFEVQQFFPKAGLRTVSLRLYAAYCRDCEVYVCYNLETQRWLVETAYDYIFDDELAEAVSRMTTPFATPQPKV